MTGGIFILKVALAQQGGGDRSEISEKAGNGGSGQTEQRCGLYCTAVVHTGGKQWADLH